MITDRSDNLGLKSNISKNLPMDLSKNSLLSSDVSKKHSDPKNNDIKQLNFANEKNNKKIRKELENDSLHSLDDFDLDVPKKKPEKKKEKHKKVITKIIVDDIENIYSNLVHKTNKTYYIQFIFLLIIASFVNVCRWMFLFISKPKLENNYCFTKLNQFDNCLSEQICKSSNKQLNIFIYNYTYDVHNSSLTDHQTFMEEMNAINNYYKHFFVSHNYQISKDKLISNIDMIKFIGDKINFAIIMTKMEQWNIFFKFSSICQWEKSYFYMVLIIIIGAAIGTIFFGLLADIVGRKKIINMLIIPMNLIINISLIIKIIIILYQIYIVRKIFLIILKAFIHYIYCVYFLYL